MNKKNSFELKLRFSSYCHNFQNEQILVQMSEKCSIELKYLHNFATISKWVQTKNFSVEYVD